VGDTALREVIGAQRATEEEDNRPDLDRIRDLALNVPLLLTHRQSDSVMVEGPLRNLKVRGKHLRPELSRARFLSELLRPRTIRARPLRENRRRDCWR
jgi:hypothetical protein